MLLSRFGSSTNYYDRFVYDMDTSNVSRDFKDFHSKKVKSDHYEASRQKFLQLLRQNRMRWLKTNQDYDHLVDISRIYRRDRAEYIAFMRIQPNGFRAERKVNQRTVIIFHVLMGNIVFTISGKPRNMQRGNFTTVAPNRSYNIRCNSPDQEAILIFRIQHL